MSISIPTTMKFIVRGKSVDFRNREGSSPSIPKGPFYSLSLYLDLYSFFLLSASKFAMLLIHSTLSQMDRRRNASLFSYHKSCEIYDIRTK